MPLITHLDEVDLRLLPFEEGFPHELEKRSLGVFSVTQSDDTFAGDVVEGDLVGGSRLGTGVVVLVVLVAEEGPWNIGGSDITIRDE